MTTRLAANLLLVALAVGAGACGGDGDARVERGRAVAQDVGCLACHSTGNTDGLGPGLGGIWGTERPLADGTTVVVDEEYIRRSIREPGAQVAAGFSPIMPTIPLTDEEFDDVVAYVRDVTGG